MPSPTQALTVPFIGHERLRKRLLAALLSGTLPQSLLLHGPRGVGKQRLALWLAQSLVCESGERPCDVCSQCRFALKLVHPDILWIFPRPRLESDVSPEAVRADIAVGANERLESEGLYSAPTGAEGIYVATIRVAVRQAAITPAVARRKVFIIGDADRMVSQEGSDQAANAFLKLLEEPPGDTYIILTSSLPGSLLPTIRSRASAVRVPNLSEQEMNRWLDEPLVSAKLTRLKLPSDRRELLLAAAGAPGKLLSASRSSVAGTAAARLLDATRGNWPARSQAAMAQGAAGARGKFWDVLEALGVELRGRMSAAIAAGENAEAVVAARSILHVEDAKRAATTNVNPQLITATLLEEFRQAAKGG
ncbi:MAG: AAA family ATPase [Gemmatimonadota bacterium]